MNKLPLKIYTAWRMCFIVTCVTSIFYAAQAEPLLVTVKGIDNGNISDVVVYVEWLDGSTPITKKHLAIDIRQKNKGFSPYLSVVQSGTTVTFSNLDEITHHIYSVTGNERFSYTIRANERTPAMKIEQSGLIAMGCNIHDWMSGYLLVIDSPFYELTDAQGRAIFDVPEQGNYRVVAWHPQINEKLLKEITIPQDNSILIKLTRQMAKLPSQKSIDDFDFLDGY